MWAIHVWTSHNTSEIERTTLIVDILVFINYFNVSLLQIKESKGMFFKFGNNLLYYKATIWYYYINYMTEDSKLHVGHCDQ